MPTSHILDAVKTSKRITAIDTLAVRRVVYHDGAINPQELEVVFALDEAAELREPEWTAFFVEAVTDYIVHQQEPKGYISEDNAHWLKDRIARDGIVSTASELEALVKVIEKAQSSPDWLAAFALDQVKHAIVHGDGPLADGHLEPGRVTAAEADLMRRVLYGFGGGGNIAVTRAEAEILFDINDATANARNDPVWNDLFVKAMANALMVASGYQPPSREAALRREEWLDEGPDTGGFLAKLASAGLKGVLNGYEPGTSEKNASDRWAERNAHYAKAAAAAETISDGEAEWLAARIGRDGVLHENEKAVLRFLAEESPNVHPSLKGLIEKAA